MKIFKVLTPLFLLVAMFVGGCGSNSKSGPIFGGPDDNNGDVVNGYQLVNITVPFDVNYAGEKKQFKVQLLEYGIPVVINTFEGTQKIKDGQRIKIDANLGAIYIVD